MNNSAFATRTFETAKQEYQDAWNNPLHTRFELPPVNINEVLEDRYRMAPSKHVTRSIIWNMEAKKAWDALTYIPYVVSEARSWGRHTLQDGTDRFCRSSMQKGWITPERGRVLEDVYVSHANQTVFFLARPHMTEENGNLLRASDFQPLFHVKHSVGGSEDEPLNLWSIVLLTPENDARYEKPFEQMAATGMLPGFVEIYIEKDLHTKLTRA